MRRNYQVGKEVSQNGYFEGDIALSDLHRLSEFLYSDGSVEEGLIKLNVEFTRSEFEVAMVSGNLKASLALQCQRCLGKMEMPIELDIKLLVDADDALVQSSSVDTIYSDDGYVDLFEVVEDELILGIPLVCMHDDIACNEHWRKAEGLISDEPSKENPFSVLKTLKTTN